MSDDANDTNDSPTPFTRRLGEYLSGQLGTTDNQFPESFDDSAPAPALDDKGMHRAYWVLSESERAKGFCRPVRRSYVHVGPPGPQYPLRDLTAEELERFADERWVKYEAYPPNPESSAVGRFWTGAELLRVNRPCGAKTTMGNALAETYARDPRFYGATYCVGCQTHFPVGQKGEFVWDGTNERVGT